ncbi:MAG: FecR domain-containing protein, partial [Candidatus Eremiobacteraeota bacterium]|nr:FecR domain-containing protein [Candidatus Eremiobacteraeota bacterium]
MRPIRAVTAAVTALAFLLCNGTPSVRAADETVLGRVRGNVGYRAPDAPAVTYITGTQQLNDQYFAITGQSSAGVLTLPDSSVVGLGANTNVQVEAFRRAETGDGTTLTIPDTGGTLRFQIRHPAGAHSNYTFKTPVATISVRGTVGLLTHATNGDTVACLDCPPGDVDVTVNASGRVYPLVTGQTLVISIAGIVAVGAITAAVLQGFSGAGLSTSAAAASPVAGSAAGAAAGASAGAAT